MRASVLMTERRWMIFYQMFSDDGTSLDVEDTVDEDTDFHVGDHTKCHQSQVAPRKLRWLNQHPYAPPGSPVSPGEPINARLPGLIQLVLTMGGTFMHLKFGRHRLHLSNPPAL